MEYFLIKITIWTIYKSNFHNSLLALNESKGTYVVGRKLSAKDFTIYALKAYITCTLIILIFYKYFFVGKGNLKKD